MALMSSRLCRHFRKSSEARNSHGILKIYTVNIPLIESFDRILCLYPISLISGQTLYFLLSQRLGRGSANVGLNWMKCLVLCCAQLVDRGLGLKENSILET